MLMRRKGTHCRIEKPFRPTHQHDDKTQAERREGKEMKEMAKLKPFMEIGKLRETIGRGHNKFENFHICGGCIKKKKIYMDEPHRKRKI